MRGGDPRGRRLAIVSHALMNAHLGDDSAALDALNALEERGYGLMALPPAGIAEALHVAALDQLIDQLQDYLRHGYAAILVENSAADDFLARLDPVCRAHGIALPERLHPGAGFREALDADRGAGHRA